jgi:outer membrane protein OmpA-like peptidoglycan-associated protein
MQGFHHSLKPGYVSGREINLFPQGIGQAAVEKAARNILFATDSYRLLPASFASLNEIVRILSANPALKMTIEGHTITRAVRKKMTG